MICHKKSLPIEEQLLVSFFIECTLAEESISQYKQNGNALIDELLHFVKNEYGDEGAGL